MKKSKRMVIAVIALFLLSGFIDLTPNYTVEELDDLYGTNIKDLSFTYKKEHHYSLLTHKKLNMFLEVPSNIVTILTLL